MPDPVKNSSAEISARQGWMGLLARAPAARLAVLMPGDVPGYTFLRAPELGAIMVEGRAGATGARFNLGEMSVTRCVLRLASGEVGHGHVQGRDRDHARNAALVDALMQSPRAEAVRAAVLDPLASEEAARRTVRAEQAAATRVEFFTLVRGEDG